MQSFFAYARRRHGIPEQIVTYFLAIDHGEKQTQTILPFEELRFGNPVPVLACILHICFLFFFVCRCFLRSFSSLVLSMF